MKAGRRYSRILSAIFIGAFALAQAQSATEKGIANLPATFVGTLPCADCPGIVYQLNLLPEHAFASRMTYQERNTQFDEHGHWRLVSGGKMLTLKTAKGRVQKFALIDPNTLRQLDANGQPIFSKQNYDLKRATAFAALER